MKAVYCDCCGTKIVPLPAYFYGGSFRVAVDPANVTRTGYSGSPTRADLCSTCIRAVVAGSPLPDGGQPPEVATAAMLQQAREDEQA